ncbi:MAG TPA: invasion associated locus B family protein [Acidocella sp.]|nr:invasion associated locus B family protein [Acidocella sp.]
MKSLLASSILALLPAAALAAGPSALGPNGGKFGTWTAATIGSGDAKICYAFTTPQLSKPNWKSRGKVMLTVTNRAGSHDEVTITAGYDYPKDAKVSLAVGSTSVDFYTQKNIAFTSSGADAVAALKVGNSAASTGPGPHGHPVVDQFSLSGFSGAYKAISSACP